MTFAEEIKQAEEEAQKQGISSSGGDWYKFTEGDNSFRVLTKPEMFFEKFKVGICYTDCGYQGSPKFMTYVLDRKDNRIKLATLPYVIGTTIAKYETDEDYKFEVFPMPYDIKVNAKGAGTKEVEYTVTPRPTKEEVNSTVTEDLHKKKPAADIIIGLKEKKKAEHVADGSWQKIQDEKIELKKKLDEVRANPVPASSIDYPENEINPGEIPF